MNNSAIIEKILHSIQMAQVGKAYYEVIFENPVVDEALHEFLFFIKPEITLPSKQINVEALLDLVFKKLSTYKLRVKDSRLLSASYLENFDIIAGHYGVINALSRDARRYLSHEARNKFRSLFGKDPDEAMVLGSIEFLQHHPGFTPVSLDELWLKNKAEKLAGGTYCMRIMVEGSERVPSFRRSG
jgi:hypothetical protein